LVLCNQPILSGETGFPQIFQRRNLVNCWWNTFTGCMPFPSPNQLIYITLDTLEYPQQLRPIIQCTRLQTINDNIMLITYYYAPTQGH